MLITEGRRFLLWKERTVFFPSEQFLARSLTSLAFNEVLRIGQTPADLPDSTNMLRRKLARTTCLDLRLGADALRRAMDAKSCRYEVRRAEKMLDRIKVLTNDDAAANDFRQLYNRFVAINRYARPLSLRRVKEFLGACDVFVIYADDRPVCSHMLLRDDDAGRVRLIFSATCRLEKSPDAALSGPLNRYLHWHEIQAYQAQGFRLFDFGGIEDGETSIAKFKLSFGGFPLVEHCYVFAGAGALFAYRLYDQAMRFRPEGLRRKRRLA
jgi:hypothetical protein